MVEDPRRHSLVSEQNVIGYLVYFDASFAYRACPGIRLHLHPPEQTGPAVEMATKRDNWLLG